MTRSIGKIISGGQTGVDRAALDFAIDLKIPHFGFCPYGRRSEDGKISLRYNLIELNSKQYRVRTRRNIKYADGTMIIHKGLIDRGTILTKKICMELNKPILIINLFHDFNLNQLNFIHWIKENSIYFLNIAGPRESSSKIYNQSKDLLYSLIV